MEKAINQRIKSVIDYLSISDREFANRIGIPQTTISNIFNRDSDVKFSVIEAIINQFGFISLNWLLTGKGDMLKKDNEELVKLSIEESVTKSIGVPYYENIEGTCGIVSQFNDYKEMPTFYINYQHFNDCNAYIPVVGDSMYPQYCSGEIIAVKRIFNMEIIQWGEAYFVVTNENSNNLKTVKLVHPHEDPDKIILRASNPNFKGDTIINKADIISMFIIKGKIKRNQL